MTARWKKVEEMTAFQTTLPTFFPHRWHKKAFWQIWAFLSILCIDSSSRRPISSRYTPPRTPRWSRFPVGHTGQWVCTRPLVAYMKVYAPGCTRHSRSCLWTLWWWQTLTEWDRRRPGKSCKNQEEKSQLELFRDNRKSGQLTHTAKVMRLMMGDEDKWQLFEQLEWKPGQIRKYRQHKHVCIQIGHTLY